MAFAKAPASQNCTALRSFTIGRPADVPCPQDANAPVFRSLTRGQGPVYRQAGVGSGSSVPVDAERGPCSRPGLRRRTDSPVLSTAHPPSPAMRIRCHRSPEAFEALASTWNTLLQRSRSDCVFLTWEWVTTWWRVFGKHFRLLLLTAEDHRGTLVGIAPLMVGRRRSASGVPFRALMLIGQQGDTLAEYLDFIIEAGREAEVVTAFCRSLQQDLASEWDYVFFERILTSSPNLEPLERQMSSARFAACRERPLPSPYVALPASWDALLAQKSRNFRSQWNNSWNRLRASGDARVLFAGADLPLESAFRELARLHRERWGDRSRSFSTEEYLSFHEEIARRFHAKGWLLLVVLALDGENIAVRYDYVYGNKLWCMQGGWSPDFAGHRVGTLLTGAVIQWGIAHGLREYDFLGGHSDYKRRWATGARTMVNLIACNPRTVRGLAWKWNRRLEDMARTIRARARRQPAARGAPANGGETLGGSTGTAPAAEHAQRARSREPIAVSRAKQS